MPRVHTAHNCHLNNFFGFRLVKCPSDTTIYAPALKRMTSSQEKLIRGRSPLEKGDGIDRDVVQNKQYM